jgi:hypothetical protein
MGGLRSNVLVGLVTAAVLGAIAAAAAIPVRLSDVEERAAHVAERHDQDVTEIRARHRIDLDGVDVRIAASERVDDAVVQMLETVQMQVLGVQHMAERLLALEAKQQGLTARSTPDEGDGG